MPEPSYAAYRAMFDRAQELIAAGDLYQVNLTFRARAAFAGDPLALYARLRPAAGAGWGAVVATGRQTLLSFSPELFVALDRGRRDGGAEVDARCEQPATRVPRTA